MKKEKPFAGGAKGFLVRGFVDLGLGMRGMGEALARRSLSGLPFGSEPRDGGVSRQPTHIRTAGEP